MTAGATVIARRVAAVPERRAGDAWRVVADLLAAPGTAAHDELLRASGPASMLIAQETTAQSPIVATAGDGPRVRIYTLHGSAASDGDVHEAPLPSRPCDSTGWQVTVPCPADDLDDVAQALAALPHVAARAAGDAPPPAAKATASRPLTVDRSQLSQP